MNHANLNRSIWHGWFRALRDVGFRDEGFERKLGGGTERAYTAPEREAGGICEQRGLRLHRDSGIGW